MARSRRSVRALTLALAILMAGPWSVAPVAVGGGDPGRAATARRGLGPEGPGLARHCELGPSDAAVCPVLLPVFDEEEKDEALPAALGPGPGLSALRELPPAHSPWTPAASPPITPLRAGFWSHLRC